MWYQILETWSVVRLRQESPVCRLLRAGVSVNMNISSRWRRSDPGTQDSNPISPSPPHNPRTTTLTQQLSPDCSSDVCVSSQVKIKLPHNTLALLSPASSAEEMMSISHLDSRSTRHPVKCQLRPSYYQLANTAFALQMV